MPNSNKKHVYTSTIDLPSGDIDAMSFLVQLSYYYKTLIKMPVLLPLSANHLACLKSTIYEISVNSLFSFDIMPISCIII